MITKRMKISFAVPMAGDSEKVAIYSKETTHEGELSHDDIADHIRQELAEIGKTFGKARVFSILFFDEQRPVMMQ
ncbi:MAG: hypothetical protein CVV44_04085 [Spirochaetae bacterium HGW-Spirochaetae-1]|jgi:hypothetical protein|nr:MAG: hypothetical protein CVV44_04085 [Spirochaetae bacterium HGW-Spirochaetae-1]